MPKSDGPTRAQDLGISNQNNYTGDPPERGSIGPVRHGECRSKARGGQQLRRAELLESTYNNLRSQPQLLVVLFFL
jgi:hypothetical protein